MDGSQDYYDASSLDSIYSFAKKLEGKTLRTACHLAAIDDPHRRKGSFGNAIEEYYFHYDINSSAELSIEHSIYGTYVRTVCYPGHRSFIWTSQGSNHGP